jgi:hypothetical protein
MQVDAHSRPSAGPSIEGERWGAGDVFVLVVTAGLLLARIPVLPHRIFDPDELQHSHVAWSVWRGMLPYKDFFEHHTPWYYFALSPFFRWFKVDLSLDSATKFLLLARGLSLLLAMLSALLTSLLARVRATRAVGLVAALFLVAQPVFLQKAIEIRPDVLALPFCLGGLLLFLRALDGPQNQSRWLFLGGGFCLGAAIMCTQKMLFVLPGTFVGLGLWALSGGRRTFVARSLTLLTVLGGIAIPAALTWVGFSLRGGGNQFIANNFLLNARWSPQVWPQLTLVLETSWPILILCLLGASVAMVRFYHSERRFYGDVLLLTTLAGLVVGIMVVPVAHRQYYLPQLPIVAIFAAKGLCFLVELAQERVRAWLLVCAILPLLVWPVVDLRTSLLSRNDGQLAELGYVYQHTRPTDLVMDGWRGTGLFRPSAFHYFFIHEELLAMLPEADKQAHLSDLESGRIRPKLIALDDNLIGLGSRFVGFVYRNYQCNREMFCLAKPERSAK